MKEKLMYHFKVITNLLKILDRRYIKILRVVIEIIDKFIEFKQIFFISIILIL